MPVNERRKAPRPGWEQEKHFAEDGVKLVRANILSGNYGPGSTVERHAKEWLEHQGGRAAAGKGQKIGLKHFVIGLGMIPVLLWVVTKCS